MCTLKTTDCRHSAHSHRGTSGFPESCCSSSGASLPIGSLLVQSLSEVSFTNSLSGLISRGASVEQVRRHLASFPSPKAAVNAPDASGYTALMYATSESCPFRLEMVSCLVTEFGADASISTPGMRWTVLHRLAKNRRLDRDSVDAEMVDLLVRYGGAPRDLRDALGHTAYDIAMSQGEELCGPKLRAALAHDA